MARDSRRRIGLQHAGSIGIVARAVQHPALHIQGVAAAACPQPVAHVELCCWRFGVEELIRQIIEWHDRQASISFLRVAMPARLVTLLRSGRTG